MTTSHEAIKQVRGKAPQKAMAAALKPIKKSVKKPGAVKSQKSCKQILNISLKVVMLLTWVAAAVIASQLIVGYMMILVLGKETFSQTIPMAVYSVLSYVLAFAWIVFATPRVATKLKNVNKHKSDKKNKNNKFSPKIADRDELGLKGLPTWTDIGLAPVGFVASLIIAAGLVAIFSIFPWFDAEQVQNVGFNSYLAGIDKVIAFLILVVVAPVVEELVFRGWLYGKLRVMLSDQMSDVWSMVLSIVLVSILFGAIHMQWNVGVNVFALSVVLCGLREITGTIYAGVLTHMLKNGVAFFLLYVIGIV